MIGSIAAALTIGLQRGGLLLAIIILPLIMPIVIF
ncbi:heme exporter protein CcmB [Acinetobacter baumannii]